jgi:hypothetical protein
LPARSDVPNVVTPHPSIKISAPVQLLALAFAALATLSAAPIGDFDQAVAIGKITLPGAAGFLPATAQYRITGSGANMWAKEDALHFLYKKLSRDLSFTMDVAWP